MRKTVFILLALTSLNLTIAAQDIRTVDTDGLMGLINQEDDKLHVVNFWATWCAPCINELPDFERAMNEYNSEKVVFHFVSLDFPSSAKKTLPNFLEKRNLGPGVVIMTNTDYDSWIRLVDADWKGNIPATLFYKSSSKTRLFHPGTLSYEEIKKIINTHI